MAKVIFITGAGISAESGLTTFRDKNGLWEQFDVNNVCNLETFEQNREQVFAFFNDRRAELKEAKPNSTHLTIAKIQYDYGKDRIKIITQNADDLLEKAGCKNVVHIHGVYNEIECLNCGEVTDVGYDAVGADISCLTCGRVALKPNVTFFNEAPKYHDFMTELETMTPTDMLVVMGTSSMAIPVNAIVEAVPGYKILNNLERVEEINHELFDKTFYEPATAAILSIEKLIAHWVITVKG